MKGLEGLIKKLPEIHRLLCKLDKQTLLTSLDTLNYLNGELTLDYSDNKGGDNSISVNLVQLENIFKPNTVVDNYNELLLVSGQELYEFVEVINSQGVSWLPGSLGGSYYGAGLYYWNGTEWVGDNDKIYESLQDLITSINTKANIVHTHLKSDITDFNEGDYATAAQGILADNSVQKNNLGWITIVDTEYTTTNRKLIISNTRTLLTNNAGEGLDLVNMLNSETIWSNTENKLTPDNSGDTYDWRLQFTVDPSLNNRNLELELDIGGTQGVIWDKTLRLARGAGVDTRITETLDIFTLQTFISNGGSIYITCDGDIEIYNISFKIERKYRA